MSYGSSIEWTEATWNPVTGCTKVSEGCRNCYAERMARRLKAMGKPQYVDGFKLRLQPQALELPKTWKKPTTVFVNSMSDLFHKKVSTDYVQRVFRVMNDCPQHTFQVLTKRIERVADIAAQLTWTDNVWLGTSVENRRVVGRIESLREVPARVRFLSIEPLLERLPPLSLSGIGWVIVGGESGPGARKIEESWVTEIRDACEAQGVPFFFKQWGGVNKKRTGRLLEGRTWDQLPIPVLPPEQTSFHV